MSTGKCSLCIATCLYPLAVISIICNIMLFFPPEKDYYEPNIHIAEEVGGLVGGGIMVLGSAIYIHLTGKRDCCGDRCGMCGSIPVAAVGAAGALYSLVMAAFGLHYGVLCKGKPVFYSIIGILYGMRPCPHPEVNQIYISLFTTLVTTSALQMMLCGIQMINGLIGCLCGTSTNQRPRAQLNVSATLL
ncbi:transmembrane 4 L6 family member 4-like [Betta splendens]|uniref:Transmembrane 4 L6 family member 4-like n=1 Tax=Betta splendens TaxID=158456 RepID=A0A9W2Y9U6_BETSP|nr:transmembrane 4 L6 family member 4-like [Betta splendens]